MRPFILFLNTFITFVLAVTYVEGWMQKALAADITGWLIPTIIIVAITGAWLCSVVPERLVPKWMPVLTYTPTLCTTLGLLGSVVGLYLATIGLLGTDMESAAAAKETLLNLVSGVGLALMTTLVGIMGSIWTGLCVRLLMVKVDG